MALRTCPSCKQSIEALTKACPWCGESLPDSTAPSEPQPTTTSAPEPSPTSRGIQIVETSYGEPKWRLLLEPDTLALTPESGLPPIRIPRREAGEKVEVIDSFLGCFITVPIPKRRTFKLPRKVFNPFLAWLGPPTLTQLKALLRKRLRWTLPAALVFMVSSLPLEGAPDKGLESTPFNPIILE